MSYVTYLLPLPICLLIGYNAFIKLGLRKYEIELLLSELPKPVREVHKFTFGVEIECLVAVND